MTTSNAVVLALLVSALVGVVLRERRSRRLLADSHRRVVDTMRRAGQLERRADTVDRHHLRMVEDFANAIPTLAWTARADGYIDWYNARWYEYTGMTHDAMKGWGWQSVHDPEVLPDVLVRWHASITKGQPFEMTFPLRRVDGQFRLFLTRVVPSTDADGGVVRWFGTNTDVHDSLKAAATLDLLAQSMRESHPPLSVP